MTRIPIESTSIAAVAYDEDSQVLDLEYVTGRVYQYRGVPREVVDWLLRARSKGSFVNRMIKDRYPYQEITPPNGEDADLLATLQASLRDKPAPPHE